MSDLNVPVKVEFEDNLPVAYVKLSDIPEPVLEVWRAHVLKMNTPDGERELTEEEREAVRRNAVEGSAEEVPVDGPVNPDRVQPLQPVTPVAGEGEEIPADVAAEMGEGFS